MAAVLAAGTPERHQDGAYLRAGRGCFAQLDGNANNGQVTAASRAAAGADAHGPPLTRGASVKADAGTRTPDPFITSEVLYQLSYVGGTPAS
jgi:hypothetical protein